MKTFIIKIISISFILIVLLLGTALLPIDEDDYLQAYNKKCELLEQTPSPRIIFVGGSNLAFSLNSTLIQDSLHLPVVNYGLHAGIGLKFMIDDIMGYVRKGDILVIAPEYSHFYKSGGYGDLGTFSLLMAVSNWKKIHLLDCQQKLNIIKGLPEIWKHAKWMQVVKNLHEYRASGFNELGDETRHRKLGNNSLLNYSTIEGDLDPYFTDYFVQAVKSLQKKCTVYIIPPVITNVAYKAYEEKIKKLDAYLKSNDIPFLVAPEKHALDIKCAYDTHYHMNEEGTNIFSLAVIDEIKEKRNEAE